MLGEEERERERKREKERERERERERGLIGYVHRVNTNRGIDPGKPVVTPSTRPATWCHVG
jgi:hypothetical protein